MPKATLEFQLPEEQSELEAAITGTESQLVITRLRQWLYQEMNMADRHARENADTVHYARGLRVTWDRLMALIADPRPKPLERHERDDDD